MNIEWWVYRVILPLSPFWLAFALLIITAKWRELRSIYKEGQLLFYAVSLAAFTMSEYERLALHKDTYYYFQLIGGVILSSFLFGVATYAKYSPLDPAEKERVGKGIGWASLAAAMSVIICAYQGLIGKS